MNSHLMVILILELSMTALGKVLRDTSGKDAITHPRYAFNYAISDPLTRDNKAQYEERDGDLVNGAYSLLQPDGNLRVVQYTADDISGFSALVKNIAARLGQQHLTKPLPFPLPPIDPSIDPHGYGFGAAPLGVGVSQVKLTGRSLPWDPNTGSFGGWVPINGRSRRVPYATILAKKYMHGRLLKIIHLPIPLPHKSVIVVKTRKLED